MKEIKLIEAEKYKNGKYIICGNGIYQMDDIYVVTLSFVQETEMGEGSDASDISQYPLE